MDRKPKIILIAGPTASGKSKIAIYLSKLLNGEIINADSMQVYKELRILTSRPTASDEKKIQHHLYGIISVKRKFSTGDWLKYIYIQPLDANEDFILFKVYDDISQSHLGFGTFSYLDRVNIGFPAPMALDDKVNIMEDTPVELDLVGFDVNNFPTNGTETIQITKYPLYGSLGSSNFVQGVNVSQLAQWKVNYTPDINYFGTDSIKYTVTNPVNVNSVSQEGTIFISISSQNDSPNLENIISQYLQISSYLDLSAILFELCS